MKEIEVNVRERIGKPVAEVFAAIVDPAQMSRYFISRASGAMKAGTTVEWEFADVGAKVSVDVVEVDQERGVIAYEWAASGLKGRVTFRLSAEDSSTTCVAINEAKFPLDEDGAKRAMGQTAGWTYFLCCMKAYLQYGVNLRAGLKERLTGG